MDYFNFIIYKIRPLFFPFLKSYYKKIGFFKGLGNNLYKINQLTFHLRNNTIDFIIAWEVFKNKEYETETLQIAESDIIVDIGAHIGLYTCYAAKKASKGLVYAYEPNPENFKILKENIKLNKLTNIHPFNLAIADKKGDIDLNLSSTNSGGHSIFTVDSKKSIKVNAMSLQDVFTENNLTRINLLKIDTEGSEYRIILSTHNKIFAKIDKIAIEYHDYFSHSYKYTDLVNCLERNGYTVKVRKGLLHNFIKTGIILAKNREHLLD